MIIGILVVVWIAVLAPIVIHHFRERDADRSIISFHRRMEKLGTDEPIVAPAHRLGVADEAPPRSIYAEDRPSVDRAPRLRLVPVGATSQDLEESTSWEEWSRSMADEPDHHPSHDRATLTERRPPVAHSRVAAYAHVPTEGLTREAPLQLDPHSHRVRRRRILLTLASSAFLSTVLFFAVSSVVVDLWALFSWVGLAGFLGLMYYAMSTGMMTTPAVTLPRPMLTRVSALAPRPVAAFTGHHDDEYDEIDDEDYAQAL